MQSMQMARKVTGFSTLGNHRTKAVANNIIRSLHPQTGGFRPLFNELFLQLVYFPAAWDILAASSMATCCKASCSVARDDGRPNKSRACLAESRMLLLIKSRKVC